MTGAMVAGLPEVSAHFSRFRVTEISLSESSQRQFDLAPILDAARLLADANVDVIAWNGTSAAWLDVSKHALPPVDRSRLFISIFDVHLAKTVQGSPTGTAPEKAGSNHGAPALLGASEAMA